MDIAQINNYGYVRGGSDRYFVELTQLLEEQGHSVHAVVTDDRRNVVRTPWVVPGFRSEKPHMKDFPRAFYSIAARRVVRQMIASTGPELAHLHIYYGQMTSAILSVIKEAGIPIVQTLHEYKLLCPIATMSLHGRQCEECGSGSFWKAAVHRCNRDEWTRSIAISLEAYISRMLGAMSQVDHFIAVSDFVRNTMIRHGVPKTRISTVHNFIDVEAYAPNYEDGKYFLYVGRIEKIKGIMTLLAAAKRVNAKLVLAGQGDLKEDVEREIELQNLNVALVGFKSGQELHELIRGSCCVIVPSEWYETFGLVILEANALGKAVIASRIGGIPEVVLEGETGLLFRAGNEVELAEAMNWVRANPSRVVEMGREGRARAKEVFGKQIHYEKILAVYATVKGV
jgi:glycosyltransferase involved in cell wall biosynthesis